jgi:uncharacterized protein YjiS (DUF1127 family)
MATFDNLVSPIPVFNTFKHWITAAGFFSAGVARSLRILIRTWAERGRERQQLLDFLANDHRAAADIGSTYPDAEEWAQRPFWRPDTGFQRNWSGPRPIGPSSHAPDERQLRMSQARFSKIDAPRNGNSAKGDGCVELDSRNREHLLVHLLGLSQHERNLRFQGAVSDKFITRYYFSINWERYAAIVWRQLNSVIGIAELASVANSWRHSELAISVVSCDDAENVRHQLIRAACAVARERGAAEVIIWFAREEEWAPRLAQKCGGAVDLVRQRATIPLHGKWML